MVQKGHPDLENYLHRQATVGPQDAVRCASDVTGLRLRIQADVSSLARRSLGGLFGSHGNL